MQNDGLEEWGNSLIQKVRGDSSQFRDSSLEFSIFYSPLRFKPKLMIIGDNPGGQISDPGLRHVPKVHEYIDPQMKYPIANIMRDKILKGEKLSKIMSESIKTNRIFFRTPDLSTLGKTTDRDKIISYCKSILDTIIAKIEPQNILAESFGTFRSLSSHEQVILRKPGSGKPLLLIGKHNTIPMFGINHPSRGFFYRIGDSDWELVNGELERRL